MTRLPGRAGRQSALACLPDRRNGGRSSPSLPCPVPWIRYLSQSTVMPSLIAFRPGSPRCVGTVSSRFMVWSLKIEKPSLAIDSRMAPLLFPECEGFAQPDAELGSRPLDTL